ncbi:MAG: tetratricopeptide repeat protein, partial [Pseudomonadota bacterium]
MTILHSTYKSFGFAALLAGALSSATAAPALTPDHLQQQFQAAYQKGDYKRALAAAERLSAWLEQSGKDPGAWATALLNQAELHRLLEQYPQALAVGQRAVAQFTQLQPPAPLELATAYNNLAVVERQLGRDDDAAGHLQNSLDLRRQHLPANDRQLAITQINLGILRLSQADYAQAQQSLDQALQLLEKYHPQDPYRVQALLSLAALFRATGDYRQAELFFEQVLKQRQPAAAGSALEQARAQNGLGSLYLLLGDYPAADKQLASAHPLAAKTPGARALVAEILSNRALSHQRQQRYPHALSDLKQSLKILQELFGPTHPDTLKAQHNLGMLYYRSGDMTAAQTTLEQVLQYRKQRSPESLPMADTLNALAGVAWAQGEAERTRDLLAQALTLRTRLLPPHHPDLATSYTNQALYLAGIGEPTASLTAFTQAMTIDRALLEQVIGFATEERKHSYLAEKTRHLYALVSLATGSLLGQPDSDRLVAEVWLQRKGMILEAQRRYQEAVVYRDAPALVAPLQQLAKLRAQLSRLIYSPPQASDAAQALAHLEEQIAQLEHELSNNSPSYAAELTTQRVNLDQVLQRLPAHSVLIEWLRFERFDFSAHDPRQRWQPAEYVALLISPQLPHGVQLIPMGAAADLEQQVSALRERLNGNKLQGAQLDEVSRKLYQRLFQPIERHFPAGTEDVWWSPDSALNLFPIEILRKDNGRYLAQDYLFSYVTSGRDLLRKASEPSRTGENVLIGNPQFDLMPADKTKVLTRLRLRQTDTAAVPRPVTRYWPRGINRSAIHFSPLPGTLQEITLLQDILK